MSDEDHKAWLRSLEQVSPGEARELAWQRLRASVAREAQAYADRLDVENFLRRIGVRWQR